MADSSVEGKKIFFFYPPSWFKEEMIGELIENEYEAYVINDHRALFPLLKKYNPSIVFINIDSGPNESEWEKYIRVINGSEMKDTVQIGILSNDNSKPIISKYLGELRVEAGYIILRQRTQDVKKSIFNILSKIDARGRRRYLRAACGETGKAIFNVPVGSATCTGQIVDISTVGMACYFDDDKTRLNVGDNLPDIQLRLMGKITRVAGKVAGIREDIHRIIVVLFDERTAFASKEKIHSFIFYSLESNMQKTLKELGIGQRT